MIRRLIPLLTLLALAPASMASPLDNGDVHIAIRSSEDADWVAARVADGKIELPPGAALRIEARPGFVPPPLPGFGAIYGDVRPVVVDRDGQSEPEPGRIKAGESAWVGVRNRFHAVMLTGFSSDEPRVSIDFVAENQPVIVYGPDSRRLDLRIYAGPIEAAGLRSADPVLSNMLYAALWNWLRWLCFGMLWLLTTIDGFVGNIGWSIVLLSISVKIPLMTPLTKYADSLQASVNRTQSLLQPQLDEIKRNYKGEEAHNLTLAVYKEHGVNPLYTLKSLVGFLIQIPIFIAAFDMLGENIALDGASFWWIDDLAAPDNWIALPFTLPFFGGYLNLMPVLMTGVTLLSSWVQQDENLTPELERAQTMRLYLMAGAFFLLFYTFPAGMVLYWTTNNVVHLIKITAGDAIMTRLRRTAD